jgi:hypothetical protein
MKRSPLKRQAALRARGVAAMTEDDRVDHQRFVDHHPTCRMCGTAVNLAWPPHHVVYRQAVRREHGDQWSPDNAFKICNDCHSSHHHRVHIIPVRILRDHNFAFARDMLGGPAAYEYLARRYAHDPSDPDPRLQALLVA